MVSTAQNQTLPPPTTQIAKLLTSYCFDTTTEDDLQRGIATVLQNAGIVYKGEAVLTKADRIDFLVDGCGIEVKTAGAPNAVLRQLHRYAASPKVKSLLLVTTRPQHNSLPDTLDGKPLQVLILFQSLL